MLSLLTARPRCPSAAAVRSKSFPRPPGPRSRLVPVPATRPPGGFPQPPAATYEFTRVEKRLRGEPDRAWLVAAKALVRTRGFKHSV